MRKSSVRRAFTLVEILVVLAIIAVLSALLLTVFSSVREGGRRTVCLSNQKQILLALQLYQEDAAGAFPYHDYYNFPETVWIDALLPYTKSSTTFVCPSDTDIESIRMFGHYTTASNGSKHPSIPASYLASEGLFYRITRRGVLPLPRFMSEVVRPASTIFLSDGVMEAVPTAPYWTDQVGNIRNKAVALGGYFLRDPENSRAGPYDGESFAPNPRHSGRANVGFVDGHVKSMELSQWYFPNTPYLDPSRGG